MTPEVKTCFLAIYISFFHFFIFFAFFLLSICLFFLSSKNFKNMLKVLFFVCHMFHIAFPVWVYFLKLISGLQNFLNLWLDIFCESVDESELS